MIQDPPIISHKGHPRTTHISGANEGAPRGGGPTNTQRKSQRVHRQAAPEETPMNGSSLHLKLSVCTGVVSVGGLAITGTTVIGPEYLTSYMYLAISISMQMACSCLLASNEIYEGSKWQKLFCTTFPGS